MRSVALVSHWRAVSETKAHLNSTSALHYLQFILRFSKLAVSKLYLDDTLHLCQHYIQCLSSERPLASQLVSLSAGLGCYMLMVQLYPFSNIPGPCLLWNFCAFTVYPAAISFKCCWYWTIQTAIMSPCPEIHPFAAPRCFIQHSTWYFSRLIHSVLQPRKTDFSLMLFSSIYYSPLCFGENNTEVQMLWALHFTIQ